MIFFYGFLRLWFSKYSPNGTKLKCLLQITGEFTKSAPLNSSTIIYENDIEVVAKVSDPTTGSTVINSVIVKLKRDGKMKWTLEPKRNDFQPGLPFVTFVSKCYTFIVKIFDYFYYLIKMTICYQFCLPSFIVCWY